MSTTVHPGTRVVPDAKSASTDQSLDQASTAFGVAACVAILLNTGLAWIKNAYRPLNSFMASLTGHHWRTHGLADIIVFVLVGYVCMQRRVQIDSSRLAIMLAASVMIGGGGLVAWFLFV